MALTLVLGLLPPTVAVAIARLLDELVTGAPSASTTGALVGLLVVGSIAPEASRFVESELSRRLRMQMQTEFFALIDTVTGLAPFERPGFRDRMRMAQQACESAPAMLMRSLTSTGQYALTIAGFAVAVAQVSLGLVAAMAAASTIQLVLHLQVARERVQSLWDVSGFERRREFYAGMLQSTQAIKELRIYALGAHFRHQMASELESASRVESRQGRREAVRVGLASLPVALTGFIGLAVVMQTEGAVSVQRASLLIAGIVGLAAAVGLAFDRWAGVTEAVRMYAIFERLSVEIGGHLDSSSTGASHPSAPSTLEVRDVWFRYADDAPWVLRGVNFVVRAGQPVGLAGVNGAGKSTLIKLICRLYEPTTGSILIDGVPIGETPVEWYRDMLGVVFQDFMTYDLTLHENIALGDIEAEDGRVQQAASLVGADEVARSLPFGYATDLTAHFDTVDENSAASAVTLSGGQWQRVALARALMRRHRPILILDEPTSGMDALAEKQVRNAVFDQRVSGVVIFVSHRLATLRSCAEILVLEGGRVTDRGSHDQLISSGGTYAAMFAAQAEGYRDDVEHDPNRAR